MPDNPDEETPNTNAADYGPPEDPMTYEETGDEAGRGRMVLLLAIVFVGAAAALLFVVFQQGVRTGGRNAPPVIVAEAGPEKVKPEDPGGLDVPHQDKTVYDRVSGEAPERVERLLPEPEEPIDISGLRSSEASNDAPDIDTASDTASDTAETGDPAKTGGDEKIPAAALVSEASKDLPSPKPEVVNEVEDIGDLIKSLPEVDEEPIGNSVAEVDEGMVNRASGTIPSATSGAYVVQIGSFRGADLASGGWEALNRKNGDLLGNLRPDIQLADLGDRGIYYRLRIGPFATKADAQALCAALKERRQDCLVRPT